MAVVNVSQSLPPKNSRIPHAHYLQRSVRKEPKLNSPKVHASFTNSSVWEISLFSPATSAQPGNLSDTLGVVEGLDFGFAGLADVALHLPVASVCQGVQRDADKG